MKNAIVKAVLAGRMFLQRLFRTRFVRFLAIGSINTLFGYGIFTVVFFITKWPTFSIVIATAIGVIFNFMTTGRFVFGNRRFLAIAPFVMGYCVTMLFNIWLVDIAIKQDIPVLLAQALSLPFVVITSYLINAKIVFRSNSARDHIAF